MADETLRSFGIIDDPDYIQAQQKLFLQFEKNKKLKNTPAAPVNDLESAAIASAIASSEYDIEKSNYEAAIHESERFASELQRNETAAADEELAKVLEVSERQAQTEIASRCHTKAALNHKRHRTEERNEGSWDCVACTYLNPPYSRTCSLCQHAAPTNVLTFCTISSLRFGLEIEMIIPDGKTHGFTCGSIALELTRLGSRVDYRGYSHETSEYWKLVTDSSLQGPNGPDRDLCFELVSPVLQGDGALGLASLRSTMENVRKLGIATNASCGFHVHVDASKRNKQAIPAMGTIDGIQRVARCFLALENAFDLLVSLSWDNDNDNNDRSTNRNRYCRSNRFVFGSLSNKQRWEKISSSQSKAHLCEMINPNNDRYMKLNMTNIPNTDRPSTIEFRQHGGVEELREAEAWVRLVLRFCEHASKCTPASDGCLLHEGATPKEELDALFSLVHCDGLEQFFVMERRLFADSRLSNEWECKCCRRRFGNSRALSQHIASTGHY